jgi:hypothetical protein
MRVFEDRVLRNVFGTQRDEVTAEWRRIHNEELHDPYCLPYGRGKWPVQGKREVHRRFWWRTLEGRVHSEDVGVAGRIILKWIVKKFDGEAWTDLAQDRDKWCTAVNTVMKFRVP